MGVIYKITNKVNNLLYIGATIDMKRRLKEYKFGSRKITKRRKYLIMLEMNKYGFENFDFDIIEHSIPIRLLNDREIYWIAQYNSRNPNVGYNSKTGGVGGTLNEVSKEKMSISSRGFRHSDEEKKRRSIPIIVINSQTLKISNYGSSKEFASYLNRSRSEVTAAIRRGVHISNHYVFYAEPNLCQDTVDDIISTKSSQSPRAVTALNQYLLFYGKVTSSSNRSVETNEIESHDSKVE